METTGYMAVLSRDGKTLEVNVGKRARTFRGDVPLSIRGKLFDGRTVSLALTTEHPSSSYGIPVLVDEDGYAYGALDVALLSWPPDAEADLRRAGYLA